MIRLAVGATEIGIACRHKSAPEARSTNRGGHADAILPGGEPVGYDGRPGARSASGFAHWTGTLWELHP